MFFKIIICLFAFTCLSSSAPQFISNPYQRQPGDQQPPPGYQPSSGPQGYPGAEYPGDVASRDAGYPQPPMQPESQAGPPPPPQINWGNCSQLRPSEREMQDKANIIKACLQAIPLPSNITQESVEKHRHDVAKCALEKENWFNQNGQYRYEKAETEIRNKRLNTDIENRILTQHAQCRQEAVEQFSAQTIPQVQLYQACMDYHISQVCGIQIQAQQQQGQPQNQ